jgi:hypothetical protein
VNKKNLKQKKIFFICEKKREVCVWLVGCERIVKEGDVKKEKCVYM